MYVRKTPGKPRRDGSKVEYVQLTYNVWDPDKQRSRAQVIHSFGRADRLDVDGMRRLIGSLERYLDGYADAGEPTGAGEPDGLRLLASRPMGAAWLLDGLWRQLGLAEAIGACLPGRRLDARISPSRLTERLRAIGLSPGNDRSTALLELAAELPAALLAQMLGIHIPAAVSWQRAAAGDWTRYAADYANRAAPNPGP